MVKSNTVTISVTLSAPVLTSIALSLSPTTNVNTDTLVTATATVSDQRGDPMSGKTVYFFNDGGYTGLNASTNASGVATITFKYATSGSHTSFVADNAQGT